MPAEDPPASAAPPPVRVTTPRELLSLVPALLGFYPRACVVVIGVVPLRGSVRVSLRFAGYDPAGPGAAALRAGFAVALLASGQCPQAAAVGYGPDQHVAPFFTLLREQADRLDIQLTQLLRAEDGRYWSCARTGPSCCPPGAAPTAPRRIPRSRRSCPRAPRRCFPAGRHWPGWSPRAAASRPRRWPGLCARPGGGLRGSPGGPASPRSP